MRDRLYLDMMQSVLGATSKVFVDQKAGNNLLYLPLDRLLQQSGASATADATATPRAGPAAEPVPPPATTDRTRDGLRSRER